MSGLRALLWAGLAVGAGAVIWRVNRSQSPKVVALRLTAQGLREASGTPISLNEAVARAHAAGNAAGLMVDADAYEGDYTAIKNLFNREKIALVVKLPPTPLRAYTTAPETR